MKATSEEDPTMHWYFGGCFLLLGLASTYIWGLRGWKMGFAEPLFSIGYTFSGILWFFRPYLRKKWQARTCCRFRRRSADGDGDVDADAKL